jgi:hypothetical protein
VLPDAQDAELPHKVRVEFFLRLIKHDATTTNGEMEVKLHAFLTWAVDGGEC